MAAAAAAAVGGGSGGHGVSGTIVGGGGVGLRLGRGPELMRRLCAINQQFATSVMEDYIRPIGEDATQCVHTSQNWFPKWGPIFASYAPMAEISCLSGYNSV